MKIRMFIARGMSRTLFIILYLLDVGAVYYVTKNIEYALIGAFSVPVVMAFQMAFSQLALKAHSIRNSVRNDAAYLQSCLEEVLRRSETVGRRKAHISLYIADNESLNCYSVGHSIIVNRSMLRLGDRNMLEGAMAHELSHIYNFDSYFSALLRLNIFAAICVLGIGALGVSTVIVLIAVLLFSLIFSSFIGFTAGVFTAKMAKSVSKLVTRVFCFISTAFSAFFCRCQDYEADRFAVLLGYSSAMLNLFRLEERTERRVVQTSWIEDLINEHPSNYRRSVQIERLEEIINKQSINEYEALPYNNPFLR